MRQFIAVGGEGRAKAEAEHSIPEARVDVSAVERWREITVDSGAEV